MAPQVYVYDPTVTDEQSKVRGVGRYLQILKENFSGWTFTSDLSMVQHDKSDTVLLNPFFNPFQPPVVSKKIAVRQILVIHDLIPLKYPSHFPSGIRGKLNLLGNKKTLSHYDLIVTDSEASKADIKEKLSLPENKIKVIYPCLPKVFLAKTKTPKFKPPATDYFIYVGDATWNKNLVNLAKAIKSSTVNNLNCVFVGKVFGQINQLTTATNPWQQELVEFFALAKGDPRFIFPGFISDGELVSLYKNARANILVSRDEGFGFSYIEASSQGIPSLLSDIAVLHEVSQDSALFVNEEKPDEISEKIKALVENEELRRTLGDEARERSRFFSPAYFKNALDKLIRGSL